MPVPACLRLSDDVFPRVRAEVARRLVSTGWSQSRAADALGVSQAMVSKYQTRDAEDDALVLRLVEEFLRDLHDETPRTGVSPWCETLSVGRDRDGGEALADVLRAERMLLDGDAVRLVPQVGLNLARALPDATGPDDVLSYPARLVAAGDRILRPAPPAFGASNHLAACLLALRERDPDLLAIANVRGGPAVRRAAPDAVDLAGDGDRVALFRAAVAASSYTPTLVHDPGAVGIEPCLYVAGRSAADVAQTILDLASQVTP